MALSGLARPRSGQDMGRRDGQRRQKGAGAHRAGWEGWSLTDAAQAPTPRPAQSVAGIEAAIPIPSVTLA